MNQIVKELRETKKYTNDCMQGMSKYINEFATAVVNDIKDIGSKLNSICERLDKLEAKVFKTTKKKTEPKIEYDVGDEIVPNGVDIKKIMEDKDHE